MKQPLKVAFLIATTLFVFCKSEIFEEFDAINNKNYVDPEDRIKRLKIFADNLSRIEELNNKTTNENLNVTVNKFSNMSPDEFSKTYNEYTPIKLASNETMDAEIARKSAIFNSKAYNNFGNFLQIRSSILKSIKIRFFLKTGVFMVTWAQLKIKETEGTI